MVFCPILALTTAAFGQETKLKSPVSELDVVFDSPVSDTVRMLVLDRITLSTEALVNYYRLGCYISTVGYWQISAER